MGESIVLVGGPDSGKTNFIGRFWISALSADSQIRAIGTPEDITYVEDTLLHMFSGSFAPRTDVSSEHSLELELVGRSEGAAAKLVVPDVSGELWHNAVEISEIPQKWMDRLKEASGALIFVRVMSEVNVSKLDWVTSSDYMSLQPEDALEHQISTQVNLCEYVRFLEHAMQERSDGRKPRIAVLVTAWDLVDAETSANGPLAFIEKEYPLFGGQVRDADKFDFNFYGVSVVGGDPVTDADFKASLLEAEFDTMGYIKRKTESDWINTTDFTIPVAWAIGMGE